MSSLSGENQAIETMEIQIIHAVMEFASWTFMHG